MEASPRSRSLATRLIAAAGLLLSAAAARAASPVPVVHIPLANITVVAAKLGYLQEEFAKLGSRVDIVDPGTTALLGAEASLLDRGDLHFASRMIYPALVHKASGIDARIIWLSGPSDVFKTPILALSDSPVKSLADLKGKSFGSGRVGCGWTAPYEALDRAGVPLDTDAKKGVVRYTNISSGQANVSALLAGQIDATATHISMQPWAAGVAQGLYKVVARTPADGVYVQHAGRTAFFAMAKFTDEHPELVQAFLRVRLRTIAWIRQHPDEAALIVGRETRVPAYIAKFNITDPSATEFFDGEPSHEAAVKSIETFYAWYVAHGDDILSRTHVDDATLRAFVDQRFFKGGKYSIYEGAQLGQAEPAPSASAALVAHR